MKLHSNKKRESEMKTEQHSNIINHSFLWNVMKWSVIDAIWCKSRPFKTKRILQKCPAPNRGRRFNGDDAYAQQL